MIKYHSLTLPKTDVCIIHGCTHWHENLKVAPATLNLAVRSTLLNPVDPASDVI